jgi:hypothetical protein
MLLSTEPETNAFLDKKKSQIQGALTSIKALVGSGCRRSDLGARLCSSSLSLSPDASRSHRFRSFVPSMEGSAVDNLACST